MVKCLAYFVNCLLFAIYKEFLFEMDPLAKSFCGGFDGPQRELIKAQHEDKMVPNFAQKNEHLCPLINRKSCRCLS